MVSAVKRRHLRASDNICSFFECTVGKSVPLRAGPDPSGTGGRVAYVYIPHKAFGGLANFNRYLSPQVGKLIGKRTWGGLVGRAVAPDIEVEHDPELVRQGRDPQLEKAVQVVLEELKKNPVPQPKRPAYPNYHTAKPAGR